MLRGDIPDFSDSPFCDNSALILAALSLSEKTADENSDFIFSPFFLSQMVYTGIRYSAADTGILSPMVVVRIVSLQVYKNVLFKVLLYRVVYIL